MDSWKPFANLLGLFSFSEGMVVALVLQLYFFFLFFVCLFISIVFFLSYVLFSDISTTKTEATTSGNITGVYSAKAIYYIS